MKINNKLSFLLTITGLILLAVFIGSCSGTTSNTTGSSTPKPSGGKDWNKIFAAAPQGASPAWSKGAPNAAVTIEEFADLQCPTCAAMHPKVQEIRAAFGDRVRIIYRQFPLQGHPHGFEAACAAEAAGAQGKFWDMQSLLFTNQSTWSSMPDVSKTFADYAEKLGLDVQKFSDDMNGIAVKNRVEKDRERGTALGVGSTPTFYINNRPYEGDLNSLKAAVEAELKKAETKPDNAGQGAETNK